MVLEVNIKKLLNQSNWLLHYKYKLGIHDEDAIFQKSITEMALVLKNYIELGDGTKSIVIHHNQLLSDSFSVNSFCHNESYDLMYGFIYNTDLLLTENYTMCCTALLLRYSYCCNNNVTFNISILRDVFAKLKSKKKIMEILNFLCIKVSYP